MNVKVIGVVCTVEDCKCFPPFGLLCPFYLKTREAEVDKIECRKLQSCPKINNTKFSEIDNLNFFLNGIGKLLTQ